MFTNCIQLYVQSEWHILQTEHNFLQTKYPPLETEFSFLQIECYFFQIHNFFLSWVQDSRKQYSLFAKKFLWQNVTLVLQKAIFILWQQQDIVTVIKYVLNIYVWKQEYSIIIQYYTQELFYPHVQDVQGSICRAAKVTYIYFLNYIYIGC